MFTGIIEDRGVIVDLRSTGDSDSGVLSLTTSLDCGAVRIGDSISVNGVCLTVTEKRAGFLTFDVSFETFKVSNLGSLKRGDRVNLERALRADGRFDGHIVSGHIDGVGNIAKKEMAGSFYKVRITAGDEVLRYVVKKGSIAVDGISLTVNSVDDSGFDFVVIPQTMKLTTLEFKNSGDKINLETDILSKYVEKMLGLDNKEKEGKSKVNAAFLAEHGFI